MDAPDMDARQLLVVGDGRAHVDELATGLRRHGHTVLGPVETVEDAMAVLDRSPALDGAVFDLPRGADWSNPIAEALRRRGVPFVFTASGPVPNPDDDASPDAATRHIVDTLFHRVRNRPATLGGNRLLGLMPAPLADAFWPHLVPVELSAGTILQEPDRRGTEVHFPVHAVLSVVGPASASRPGAEIALIGPEGMTGITEVLGGTPWPFGTIVQVAGEALAIEAERFAAIVADRPAARDFLLRYVQALLVQAGDTALANARGILSQRLARRIVMTHDRMGADVLPLTHQQLATMLGVRRASVTEALHLLEGDGIVRSLRGRLLVRNRAALLDLAAGYYGAAEAAYERLLADRT
ncbi:MAG: helix-turn-helix domain-containing protein [Bauldia sp.]|nr:helix-turn-helix domain-containing protein [Bauldia sp.]